MITPTLRGYYELLSEHDWGWRNAWNQRSEEQGDRYFDGLAEETRLLGFAELSGGHARCWREWALHAAAPDVYRRPEPEDFDFEDAI